MTRLEKDAIKRLIILGAAFVVVAIIYYFSRDIGSSLCGFGLMGFLGFVRQSKGKGPELDEEKVKKMEKWSIIPLIILFLFFSFQIKDIFMQFNKGLNLDFGAVFASFFLLIAILFLIFRGKKVYINKTLKLPKYDERENNIIKNSSSIAFTVFWIIFIFASVSVGIFLPDKQISTYYLSMQGLIAWWIYAFAYNSAIIWQEQKLKTVLN